MFRSLHRQIQSRIESLPCGAVLVVGDFLDIAESKTVSKTLIRLTEYGIIGKIMQGVFWKPSLASGETPSPEVVADALARSNCWHHAPSGDTALYLTGLEEKKPAVWTFITDGTCRIYKYGDTVISFTHASGKFLSSMSKKAATFVQVIRAYGQEHITDELLCKIRSHFSPQDEKSFINEIRNTSQWIVSVAMRMFSH